MSILLLETISEKNLNLLGLSTYMILLTKKC